MDEKISSVFIIPTISIHTREKVPRFWVKISFPLFDISVWFLIDKESIVVLSQCPSGDLLRCCRKIWRLSISFVHVLTSCGKESRSNSLIINSSFKEDIVKFCSIRGFGCTFFSYIHHSTVGDVTCDKYPRFLSVGRTSCQEVGDSEATFCSSVGVISIRLSELLNWSMRVYVQSYIIVISILSATACWTCGSITENACC